MTVLVTGAAGFIGMHVAATLLDRGEQVVGVDNVNNYYAVSLKEARLATLTARPGFTFHRMDLAEREGLLDLVRKHPEIDRIVHLAAQPGVRYSVENPRAYITANVNAHLEVLEAGRHMKKLRHLVFASSSSVYGGNTKLPFSVDDPVEQPNSLYAATKRTDELFGYTYAHLFGIPATGLRFFTVYGPWGRPDMAAFIFTRQIIAGEPIKVFNRGEMWRDFTYIDDIVSGVVRVLDRPAKGTPPHMLYNLGNHRSEKLTDFIAEIEKALGRRAKVELEPMQMGDVPATYADIEASRRDLGFEPTTPISAGIPKFIAWYKDFYGA